MALSNELISELIKTTNARKNTPTYDNTVYGTIVNDGENLYAKIDGSEGLTPITTTVELNDGDRVMVAIKNHSATVVGNTTSPAIGVMSAGNFKSMIDQQADRITLAVEDIGNVRSELELTADGITQTVSNNYGEFTELKQTVDGITLEVSEQAGVDGTVYARITLGIGENSYSGLIQMTGNLEVSGQLSADALYSAKGDIADLTVNALSTSRRVLRYLARDLTDDDYIRVQGETLEFVTSTTDGSTEQATTPNGLPIYWEADPDEAELGADGYPYTNGQRIFTTTAVTDWPVYVYSYTELVKRSTYFTPIDGVNVPVDTFGAGDEKGNNKGWLVKDTEGLKLLYRDGGGNDIGVSMSYEGFLDLFGMRRTVFMDFSEVPFGKFYERVEGNDIEYGYSITFDDYGRPLTITDDTDGHVCTVKWWDETS